MFDKVDSQITRGFVSKYYKEASAQIFITAVDSQAIAVLKLLKIDADILETINGAQNDLFTFYSIADEAEIDLMLLLYVGAKADNGFICIYMPQLIANQTNIWAGVALLLENQKQLDMEQIFTAIISDIRSKISSQKDLQVIKTDDKIFIARGIK